MNGGGSLLLKPIDVKHFQTFVPRLAPEISLFSGDLPPSTNSSSVLPAPARGCPCTSTPANALPGQCDQESHGCRDPRASSVLEKVVSMSNEENLPTLASLEEGGEGGQVATVKVVGGPVVPRPLEGWTASTAAKFCREFLQTSAAVIACTGVAGVEVEERIKACEEDVLVSAQFQGERVALLAWVFPETCYCYFCISVKLQKISLSADL